jgi:hypothetical protein
LAPIEVLTCVASRLRPRDHGIDDRTVLRFA